jgi:hypothetical protein
VVDASAAGLVIDPQNSHRIKPDACERCIDMARATGTHAAAAHDAEMVSSRASFAYDAGRSFTAPSAVLRPEHVLALQCAAGNQAVQRLMVARLAPAPSLQRAGGRSRKPQLPEGVLPSTRLGKLGTADETAFRRTVYEKQLEMSASDPRKQFLKALTPDQLEKVEAGHKLRKGAVAVDATSLLAQARRDLATEREQAKRGAAVLKVGSIGIGSAYRSLQTELGAWERAYATSFSATKAKREALKDGEFGDAAAKLMARRMYLFKASPGYSKHTKGLAIDGSTRLGCGVILNPAIDLSSSPARCGGPPAPAAP